MSIHLRRRPVIGALPVFHVHPVFAVLPCLAAFAIFLAAFLHLRTFALAEDVAAPAISGRLERVDGIAVLTLWGSPRERGFAHGWLLAEEVVRLAEEGFALLGQGAEATLSRLAPLMTAGFSFSADETAEMEGIADAVAKRLPGRKVKPLDRALTLVDLKIINTFGDWYALGCSSATAWGKLTPDGKPVAVRNWDFLLMRSLEAVQHVRVAAPAGDEKARGWVGVALPGCIAPVTAMNDEGVFAAINDVFVRPGVKDYIQPNVPRLIALRRILESVPASGAVEKAADLCRTWNTLFGNNFLIVTPSPAGGLPAGVLKYDTREDRERGVTLRGPDGGEGNAALEFLACSNGHRLRGKDSCWRYDALAKCCAERKEPFDLDALRDLVSRAAVPARGAPVGKASLATAHQAIAFTGERRLWIRFLESREKNIRDAKGVDFRVDALLSRAKAPASPAPKS